MENNKIKLQSYEDEARLWETDDWETIQRIERKLNDSSRFNLS